MAEVNSILADKLENSAMNNRLFVYADKWHRKAFKSLPLRDPVNIDPAGREVEKPARMSAEEIYRMWEKEFPGNKEEYYLNEVNQNEVSAAVNANTSPFKSSFSKEKIRTFVRSHNLHRTRLESRWKIDGFTYHLENTDNMITLK